MLVIYPGYFQQVIRIKPFSKQFTKLPPKHNLLMLLRKRVT